MHRKSFAFLVTLLSLSSLLANVARGESTLSVVGVGQLREAAHQLDIELDAEIATIDETITLANWGPGPVEALYSFELPRQAAIGTLEIESERRTTVYGVVGAGASTRLVADPSQGAEADAGLLRMIALDQDTSQTARRRYELRVFPVPGKGSATVKIRWQVPIVLAAGVSRIRIPERADHHNLARTQVTVAAGNTLSLRAGGKLQAKARGAKNYSFFAPAKGALIIEVERTKKPARLRAQVALMPLSPTSGVAAVVVDVPDVGTRAAQGFDRALLIVDVSKSMGEAGRKAARDLSDSVLTELGTATLVEAIVYDRHASRVLGRLQAAERSVRSAISLAISSAPRNNGSDLEGALKVAGQVLAERGQGKPKRTLIVIITDNMQPTQLAADDALRSLGKAALAESKVLAAVLVPDNQPLPDLQDSAVFGMASRAQGRTLSLRHGDVQGLQVLKALGRPAPLDTVEVEFDRGTWVGADFLGSIPAGTNAIALGYYEGGLPKQVKVVGLQDGKRITLKAVPMSKAKALPFARMVLADSTIDSFPGDTDPKTNKVAFQKAATTFGVITEASAGVAVFDNDGFGQDRLKLAKRWGGAYYRRLAPAPELASQTRFEAFRLRKRSPAARQKTGQLDPEIIARRIKAHVIPPGRGCYNRLLRSNQQATGALTLHIEVARGEVQFVKALAVTPELEPISACVVDAAYGMPIPKVGQGADPELINIALYPLRFRPQSKGKGNIKQGRFRELRAEDFTDPLFGLPD